jgi:hypothetical protein
VKLARFLIPTLALLLTGCAKNIKNNEAVKKGVVDYLSKRSDLSMTAMEIEVTNVKFTGDDQAEAVVAFKPKGMDAAAGMQINYKLEKKAGAWVVIPKSAGSASPHGAPETPAMPPGHPPAGGMPGTVKQ